MLLLQALASLFRAWFPYCHPLQGIYFPIPPSWHALSPVTSETMSLPD